MRIVTALIGDSVGKVDAGSKLVEQAGTTMNEVVTSVKRVSDIISEIAAASAEQEAGISQINIAITEMDNVTQQNAALVEEAAAAAGSMQDQADHLVDLVKVFKVDTARDTGITLLKPASPAAPNRSTPARKLSVAHSAASAAPTVARHSQLKSANGGDWEEF